MILAGQLTELAEKGDAQLSVEERQLKNSQEQAGAAAPTGRASSAATTSTAPAWLRTLAAGTARRSPRRGMRS